MSEDKFVELMVKYKLEVKDMPAFLSKEIINDDEKVENLIKIISENKYGKDISESQHTK